MGLKIYIVAGEPSGDLLAAGLMQAVRRQCPDVQFHGVGGERMTELGIDSLFPISDISVMGLFEVLPRLPLILKRLRQTVADIETFRPDVIVTVDSWGFVSSLLTRLQKRWRRDEGAHVPVVHYVAPQVWAWKAHRAKRVARLVDRLMTLMPDEGRYFEKYGLHCDFVGHPVVERIAEAQFDTEGFRKRYGIPDGARVVTILPGSRRSEVKRLWPILRSAAGKLTGQDLFFVVPMVENLAGCISTEPNLRVVTGAEDRYNAFKTSVLALSKSGTVSLELAAVGVPHLIAYTFNPFTNWVADRVVKVPFANLINLLADREIVPEFTLDKCRADLIGACAEELLSHPDAAQKQVAEAQAILKRLRLPAIMPSDRAAQIVIETAKK